LIKEVVSDIDMVSKNNFDQSLTFFYKKFMKYIVTVYFYETIKLILFLYFQTQPKRTISRHIPKTMYSLVSDIDMVSKNIFDHNFFLQKNYEL